MSALNEVEVGVELMIVGKSLAALALGGVIGYERELAERPAGFRTHMLVCVASCLLVSIGLELLQRFVQAGFSGHLASDPFRIIEAIVTGIAFLGAGTIIQKKEDFGVKGLTTAGSLLLAGAIGIAVGVQLWITAVAMTLVSLVLLRALNRFERWARRKTGVDGEDAEG